MSVHGSRRWLPPLTRRRWLAAVAATSAVAAMCLTASPGAAWAGDSPTPPRQSTTPPYGMDQLTYQRMLAQIPLDAAATQIQAAAAKPGAGHDGFFETSVNDDQHTLTVYWHGALPADISQLIHRLQQNTTIQVAAAAYGQARLHAAVLQSLHTPGVVGARPLNDGSGIVVEVSSTDAAPAAAALAPRLGVPVRTAVTRAGRPQATCVGNPGDTLGPGSRCYDLAPGYWGGDVIIDPLSAQAASACTTAFGVHDAAGGLYMLTAAHCALTPSGTLSDGVTFYNGNETQTMGQIIGVPGPDDGAIIPTSAGNRWYDGPGILSGDTYNTQGVIGQGGTSPGDWLCESGSFGGVRCGTQVAYTGVSRCDKADGLEPAHCWDNLALATQPTNGYSIGGDSGGPWFALAGSGTVSARGVHHGLEFDDFGNLDEAFTPISVLSADLGVWANT